MKKRDKQIVTGLAVVAGMIFLIKRLSAKSPPTGEVFIGPVTVTPTKYTADDAKNTVLTSLVRRAYDLLALDLDEMAPRRRPDQTETLVLQSIIKQLADGGRDSESRFIAQMLTDSQQLGGATV